MPLPDMCGVVSCVAEGHGQVGDERKLLAVHLLAAIQLQVSRIDEIYCIAESLKSTPLTSV